MSTRSAVLAIASVPINTDVTIATVPVGELWILKSMLALGAGAVSGPIYCRLIDSTGLITVTLFEGNADTHGRAEWEGWATMSAGETIHAHCNTGPFGFRVSGTRLLA